MFNSELNSNLKTNEIAKIIAGVGLSAGGTAQELWVLECEGRKTITFTPIGYGNYRNGAITLYVYGANTYIEGKNCYYNISCPDRELIKELAFDSGAEYTVDISDYKYVSFSAKNNNDAENTLDLTHVKLV